MRSISNKIYKTIQNNTRTKAIKSLKLNFNSRKISNNFMTSSYINKSNKNITSYEYNNISTNNYSYNNNITKSNLTLFSRLNNKTSNKNYFSLVNIKDKTYKNESKENSIKKPKKLIKINKKFNFKKLNSVLFKSETELKNDKYKNSDDEKYLLPEYLNIKNFKLKTSKILDYLELSKSKKFVINENKIKSQKQNNIKRISIKKKLLNRAKSSIKPNKLKLLEEIYPTILNIEGQRNRKILIELDIENRKKRKIEGAKFIYNKQNLELRKKMLKEKWKIEEYSKVDISRMAYQKQLSILSMKLYQNAIKRMNRKNAFKFNLDFPLYNVFLNID